MSVEAGTTRGGYRRVVVDRFGGPEVLRIETRETPPSPEPGQVRVRVLATTANATDTVIRKGLYPLLKLRPPFVLGYDMVGEIDALGSGVTDLAVGDRVSAMPQVGAGADHVCLDARACTPIPRDVDPADAACFVVSWITAYQMIHRMASVRPDDVILVNGASGAVGTALVQLARVVGARVVGTASTPKLEGVRELGAAAVDYRSPTVAADLRWLAPDGYDAIFDPVGVASFWRSFALLRPRSGRLVTYAVQAVASASERKTAWTFLRFGLHFGAMVLLLAVWSRLGGGRTARFYGVVDHHRDHRDWYRIDLARLFELRGEGAIEPIVTRMPLEDIERAHRLLDAGYVCGQLVLLPSLSSGTTPARSGGAPSTMPDSARSMR